MSAAKTTARKGDRLLFRRNPNNLLLGTILRARVRGGYYWVQFPDRTEPMRVSHHAQAIEGIRPADDAERTVQESAR